MNKLIIVLLFLNIFSFIFTEELKDDYIKCKIEKIEGSFIAVSINQKSELLKLAPKWYILNNEYNFKIGDEIKIKVKEMNEIKHITEIVKENRRYKFTDDNGEFLWHRKGWMDNEGKIKCEKMQGEGKHNRKGHTK